ncbi:MAG: tetratricopeptide repeat protein [Candidatus Sericytochromatia bacterium]|nr:tetratricopeptide repeat protein [Candidatus Sericytochromatia bacterium]
MLRRPTSPQEALEQLRAERNRPFWRTPSLRLTTATILLLILMSFLQNRLGQPPTPVQQKYATPADLDNAAQYFTRARIYLEHDRPGEAISDYSHVLKDNPASFLALQGRAQAWLRLDQPEQALADFTAALALKPDAMELYNNRALVYMQLGRPDHAMADYNQALKYQPDSALLHANRGLAWADLGKSEQALADFRLAQRLNPAYALAFFFEGNHWLAQKMPGQAETAYTQALRLQDDLSEALHNRGLAREQLGRCSAALADFERACALGYTASCDQSCS